MKYRVYVTRTTIYEGEAENEEAAVDGIDDTLPEVSGDTRSMDARPICPTCDEELSDRTTRTITISNQPGAMWEEPTYCDSCDREIVDEEQAV